jgi:hypothetical protein
MNLALQPVASREDLGDFFYLRLFRHWVSASNRMTGIVDGVPVDMADYAFTQTGRGPPYRQTVLLLPAPEGGLPPFELRPRGHLDRFFGLGLNDTTGTTVRPYKGQAPLIRKCTEHFRLRYDLRGYYSSDHLEEAANWAALKAEGAVLWSLLKATLPGFCQRNSRKAKARGHYQGTVQADNGLEPNRAGAEAETRRLFNLDLLHFFADHTGWCMESDGTHLALWRPYRTTRAAKRARFVAEALEVYRALARAGALAAPKRSQAVPETENRQA